MNNYNNLSNLNDSIKPINMSEYQKIIFVNNIDELQAINDDILKNDKYNFVVFFTDTETYNDDNEKLVNYDWDRNAFGDKIYNIWYKGQRLNRFIGIDETKSTINLGGGHVIKLMFDYNSGLLSLSDLNQLESIIYEGISFTDVNGSICNYNGDEPLSNIIVNSINNIFSIYIRFTVKSSDSEANVHKIVNGIKFEFESKDNDIIKLLKSPEEVSNDSNITTIWKYTYKIIKNTETDTDLQNHDFIITSLYDDSKTIIGNNGDNGIGELTLRLNPTNIKILYGENNQSEGVQQEANKLMNHLIISNDQFVNNSQSEYISYDNLTDSQKFQNLYNLKINIYPKNIIDNDSYSYPKSNENNNIRLRCISENGEVVKFIGENNINSTSEHTQEINNYEYNVGLIIGKARDNTSVQTYITLQLEYKNSETDNTYVAYSNINCSKTYSITVNGEQNLDWIYFGFENPLDEEFDERLIWSHKGIHYPNYSLLYDWSTELYGEGSIHDDFTQLFPSGFNNGTDPRIISNDTANRTKPFYIAIPSDKLTSIDITWDAYVERSYTQSSDRDYLDNDHFRKYEKVFSIAGHKIFKNIEFTIYRSLEEYNGKFFGKIQKVENTDDN